MIETMTPCSVCHRHVKDQPSLCPFCGAPFAAARVATSPPGTRLVAAVAIGATVGLAACTQSQPMLTAFYGASDCEDACGGGGPQPYDAAEEPIAVLIGDGEADATTEVGPEAGSESGTQDATADGAEAAIPVDASDEGRADGATD